MSHSLHVPALDSFSLGFESAHTGNSLLIHANCFEWLAQVPADSIHAVVTDPPYGVKEFEASQLQKRAVGSGGIWRQPPRLDGHSRSPLPRFTALTDMEREELRRFYRERAALLLHALRPGGHVFIASNAFLSSLIWTALEEGGLEFRGEVIRLVRTLRGGDRPKNAEAEFPDVCTLPRGCYEPWGLFRKPLPPGMTVAECLRQYQTGALRRLPDGMPFLDVIGSERTAQAERTLAAHPSLKPQSFLRQVVHAVLPLGVGIIVDPFMGSGSTIAAAEALGLVAIGIEQYPDYYVLAKEAIPRLARVKTDLVSPIKKRSA